jgi:chemotaxis family two-component system sensor kinase Cph1
VTYEVVDGEGVFGVKDNGIGIESDQPQQIFEPFKRLHGRTEFPGSGIGLSICKRAITQHGGRIWVEPNAGSGAHFKFVLKQAA